MGSEMCIRDSSTREDLSGRKIPRGARALFRHVTHHPPPETLDAKKKVRKTYTGHRSAAISRFFCGAARYNSDFPLVHPLERFSRVLPTLTTVLPSEKVYPAAYRGMVRVLSYPTPALADPTFYYLCFGKTLHKKLRFAWSFAKATKGSPKKALRKLKVRQKLRESKRFAKIFAKASSQKKLRQKAPHYLLAI